MPGYSPFVDFEGHVKLQVCWQFPGRCSQTQSSGAYMTFRRTIRPELVSVTAATPACDCHKSQSSMVLFPSLFPTSFFILWHFGSRPLHSKLRTYKYRNMSPASGIPCRKAGGVGTDKLNVPKGKLRYKRKPRRAVTSTGLTATCAWSPALVLLGHSCGANKADSIPLRLRSHKALSVFLHCCRSAHHRYVTLAHPRAITWTSTCRDLKLAAACRRRCRRGI